MGIERDQNESYLISPNLSKSCAEHVWAKAMAAMGAVYCSILLHGSVVSHIVTWIHMVSRDASHHVPSEVPGHGKRCAQIHCLVPPARRNDQSVALLQLRLPKKFHQSWRHGLEEIFGRFIAHTLQSHVTSLGHHFQHLIVTTRRYQANILFTANHHVGACSIVRIHVQL